MNATQASQQDDQLLDASMKNTYSHVPSKRTGYKEKGVTIRVGGPEEKEGDADKKDAKADGEQPKDNTAGDKPPFEEEAADVDMTDFMNAFGDDY